MSSRFKISPELLEKFKDEFPDLVRSEKEGVDKSVAEVLLHGVLVETLDPSRRSANDQFLSKAYDSHRERREALRPLARELVKEYEQATGHRVMGGPPTSTMARPVVREIISELRDPIADLFEA